MKEGITEASTSLLRAQVLVTSNSNYKSRTVVDCGQTVDGFIYLEAYPLLRIDTMINKIAEYSVTRWS